MNIITLHLVNTIITIVGWLLFYICCNSSNSITYTDLFSLFFCSFFMALGLDGMVMTIREERQKSKFEKELERKASDALYVYLKDKPVINVGYDKNLRCHFTFKVTSATKTFIGGTRIEWKMTESVNGKKVKGTAQLIEAKGGILFVINYCDKNGKGFGIPNEVIKTISSDLDMTTKYDIDDTTTYAKHYKL